MSCKRSIIERPSFTEPMQAPSHQQSHIPPAQAREGEGEWATRNPPGHTHSTVRLLPRFRKVVALSTNPDGKENEWRRKLKEMTWIECNIQ